MLGAKFLPLLFVSFVSVEFWWSVVKLVLRGLLRLDFCPGFRVLTPGG